MESSARPMADRRADRILLVAALIAASLLFFAVILASKWPFLGDAPLLHYMVFLMGKGFAPYRDILDMNMPGTYLLQSLIMHVFGGNATGWFLWDAFSMVLVVLASAWIAGPLHRASGILAGSLACILHIADGAWDLGQRDWNVAVLLLISFGCLFHFLRGARGVWIGAAWLCAGLAVTIKPPALLFPVAATLLVCLTGKRSRGEIVKFLLWALAGLVLPVMMVVLFLAHWHVGHDFVAAFQGLVPYYATLQKASFRFMLWSSLQNREKLFAAAAVAALLLYWANRSWRSLEMNLLLTASFCGLVSYLVQSKGFGYHRYPLLVFLTLLIVLQIDKSLRQSGLRLYGSLVLLAAVIPAVASLSIRHERDANMWTFPTVLHLQADLTRLGGSQLSGHVQCLDMTWGGCINTLYRMQLVQSTGFIYDFYLFPQRQVAFTQSLQERFFNEISANPPKVFVLSEHVWPEDRRGYDEVARWPRFQSFLDNRYTMSEDYTRGPGDPGGYRIYLLK